MKKKKFTIDRRTWLRGEGSESSFLLRQSDGKMCCLGSAALSCGIERISISGVTTPGRLSKSGVELPGWYEELVVGNEDDCSSECSMIMNINDTKIGQTIFQTGEKLESEEQREKLLKEAFAELGVEPVFKN